MTFRLHRTNPPARRPLLPAENVITEIARPTVRYDEGGFARNETKGRHAMRIFITAASLMLAAMAIAPAAGAQHELTAIPNSLKAPSGNVLLFTTFASGAQLYVCAPQTDDPNKFAWTFKAPVAVLWNDQAEQVGTHYAGPSWEGNDGSKVVGEVVARADAPNPGTIPSLLLKAKANDGAGIFSSVTYIQRLQTVGGVAPTEACDRSVAGLERAVRYTALYGFYGRGCCDGIGLSE